MADKSWMLNPQGIRAAKACITCVKQEFDVKLTLSDPEFLALLHKYVELAQSKELDESYAQLLALAGVGNVMDELGKYSVNRSMAKPVEALADAVGDETADPNMVTYRGKAYNRYREGKQFAGLYRGQPRYV